jgi:hypothetical protein
MEGRYIVPLVLGLLLSGLVLVSRAEPDSYMPSTSYKTTTVTKGSGSSASYWNKGSEVAVYLVVIPLLLIPLIIIGLKLAERGGYTGKAEGHYVDSYGKEGYGHGHGHRSFEKVGRVLLADLTKRVLDAIKVNIRFSKVHSVRHNLLFSTIVVKVF